MNVVVKILAIGFAATMVMTGCKKKEEKPVTQAPSPAMEAPGAPGSPAPDVMVPKETTLIVPENVKGKWSKVKLVLQDKVANKSTEYVVNIGSEFNVPDTKLKIVVGEFLPDFRMDGATITSGSNEPNNPAVKVEVFEDGKSIFKGWLYAKFPAIHPFEHQRYGLTLKEGIRKG